MSEAHVESVLNPTSSRYTRLDFMALRYLFNKIAPEVILRQLYNLDALEERGIETPEQLRVWLNRLKRLLVNLSLRESPQFAELLEKAEQTDTWHRDVMDHLIQLGERDYSKPSPSDEISQWFRFHIVKALTSEGIYKLEDLKSLIESRGNGWFRPIPRIGPGRALAIVNWLKANESSIGVIDWPRELEVTSTLELSPDLVRPLVPLEQISSITSSLDGTKGVNRNRSFCLISAKNDLEAIHAYLYKFRDKPPTFRSYRKELERFLLWCVCYQRTSLSDVLLEECEAYKDFIALPPSSWIGPRVSRTNSKWRPFAGKLSPSSQRYAIQVIRSCFEWLVNVRYLSGNPWITVADPSVPQKELSIQIDKAIPQKLWNRLTKEGGLLDQVCETAQELADEEISTASESPFNFRSSSVAAAQFRLARAAVLLIGLSGIRREEASFATRDLLKKTQDNGQGAKSSSITLWELSVLGKRSKWRTVFLPPRVLRALSIHWEDRGLNLFNPDDKSKDAALLSPIVVPPTSSSRFKHILKENGKESVRGEGFMPDALHRLIRSALQRIATDPSLNLSSEESSALYQAAPHSLRHTFATIAAAKEMPLDVLQKLLGHTSINTTSIYIQAEKQRSIEEVQKLFNTNT